MISKKKYKTYIAALFLALYTFIAIPVQLWHHHTYEAKTTTANSKDKLVFSKSLSKTAESNCQICSHHYSSYNNIVSVVFATPLFAATAKEGFYNKEVPSSPLLNISNKGPPFIS